jgi:short subunit dehydrogenase-like uncharacterized protein
VEGIAAKRSRCHSIPAVNDPPSQIGPVAVYGATGYTGKLVAAELRRRGAEFVLAGRSALKLEIVAEDVGGAPVEAVAIDDDAGLRALLEPCAAVIACAGPFQLHGEPVLAAAADAGTHYVDTTGEQPFMRKVFDDYGERFRAAGVAAVTAMGFDYVPGDMIASLTAAGLGPLDELTLAYWTRGFGASRGTTMSALGILEGGDAEWRDGELRPAPQSVGRGRWTFREPVGEQRMVRYPAGEHVTVPRHVETRNVRTVLSASTAAPHPSLSFTAPVLMPMLQLATRTPLKRAMAAVVSRLPEGPEEEDRRRSRFTIDCEAVAGTTRRRGTISGRDVYGLTARTTVEAALRLAAPSYDRAGALAPSEAFDPEDYLAAMASAGVDWEVEPT